MKGLLLLSLLLVFGSCDSSGQMVATHPNYKTVMREEVVRFCNKKGFEGIPILTFGSHRYDRYVPLPNFPFYDSTGRYLSFDDTVIACKDRNFYYLQVRELFKHHIPPAYSDSSYFKVLKNGLSEKVGYATHLTNYSNLLYNLDGGPANIDELYGHYLLLYEFGISGDCKYCKREMKEMKDYVDQLNSEFGNMVQLVLINFDNLPWMKYTQ